MTVVARRVEEPLEDVFATLAAGSEVADWVVEEVAPPSVISLKVRAWPDGAGRVRVVLRPYDGGTEIRFEEHPVDRPAPRLDNPLLRAVVRARMRKSLRRLSNVVASGVRQTA